jgi:hypothetical protein
MLCLVYMTCLVLVSVSKNIRGFKFGGTQAYDRLSDKAAVLA